MMRLVISCQLSVISFGVGWFWWGGRQYFGDWCVILYIMYKELPVEGLENVIV